MLPRQAFFGRRLRDRVYGHRCLDGSDALKLITAATCEAHLLRHSITGKPKHVCSANYQWIMHGSYAYGFHCYSFALRFGSARAAGPDADVENEVTGFIVARRLQGRQNKHIPPTRPGGYRQKHFMGTFMQQLTGSVE
jgi:hypothetical protein